MIQKSAPPKIDTIKPEINQESLDDSQITTVSILSQAPPKKKYLPVAFPSFRPKSDYWNFTKQYIYVDKGTQTAVRWRVYLDFVEQGLIPLAKYYGYHLNAKPIQIVDNLCRVTFALSKNKYQPIRFTCDPEGDLEDYDNYCYLLNSDVWDSFWQQWSDIYDFSNECEYGEKVRYKLHNFLWSFVNIELSSATKQFEDDLSDSELDQIDHDLSKQKNTLEKDKEEKEDDHYNHQSKFYS